MAQSNLVRLTSDYTNYPAVFTQFLASRRFSTLNALGNLDILHAPALAFFCSIRCPGNVILQTYDLVRALREAAVPVIGGFHTPMEKECLDLLLRGTQPIILCPARSIEGMRLHRHLNSAIAANRLLILSPFAAKHRRQIANLASERNQFVAALATALFVTHAAKGGKTEALSRQLIATGKSIYTFDLPENAGLIEMGAIPMKVLDFLTLWPPPTKDLGEP